MQSTLPSKRPGLQAAEQAPSRGPLPLDPALLAQVRGGVSAAPVLGKQAVQSVCVEKAPKGRW